MWTSGDWGLVDEAAKQAFEDAAERLSARPDSRIEVYANDEGLHITANAAGFLTLADLFALAAHEGFDAADGDHLHLGIVLDQDMATEGRIILDFSAIPWSGAGNLRDVSLLRRDDPEQWPAAGTPASRSSEGTWVEESADLHQFRGRLSGLTEVELRAELGDPTAVVVVNEVLGIRELEYGTAAGRRVFVTLSAPNPESRVVGIRHTNLGE
jgi:hypothetical protein